MQKKTLLAFPLFKEKRKIFSLLEMQSCSFLFLPFSVCIEWWKMSSFPIWLSATNTGKVWTPEVVYLHRLCVRRDFFHVSVCVSIFKKLRVWLNRRKWLWLPQEMREETRSSDPSGCTGATRRLTGQREGGRAGWSLDKAEILLLIVPHSETGRGWGNKWI